MHYLSILSAKIVSLIVLILIISSSILCWRGSKRFCWVKKKKDWLVVGSIFCLYLLFVAGQPMNTFLSLDYFMETQGPGIGPQVPLDTSFEFLSKVDSFRIVDDIARDPRQVPALLPRSEHSFVLESEEVINEIAPDVFINTWVFNGQVPGPFLRVRQGDRVNITFRNHPSSLHEHSIDFHAVTGPGGGAKVLKAMPGEEAFLSFIAKNPGLYVYHCATPNVAAHMTHGLYGLILVEPPEGFEPVDKEFYVMQGEFYTSGAIGKKGLQIFDAEDLLSGDPTYVVFNGRVGGLNGKMHAEVGDRVRIFVGNGGVNLLSSFHVIGEIFDTVYPEASWPMQHNVQTTVVPAGGAAIVEFDVDLPGEYVLVDHSLARLDKGAWGVLNVKGQWDDRIYTPRS